MPTSTEELPLLTLAHGDFLVEDDDRAPLVASFVTDRQSHLGSWRERLQSPLGCLLFFFSLGCLFFSRTSLVQSPLGCIIIILAHPPIPGGGNSRASSVATWFFG